MFLQVSVILSTRGWFPSMHHMSYDQPPGVICLQGRAVYIQGRGVYIRSGGSASRGGGPTSRGGRVCIQRRGLHPAEGSASRGICIQGDRPPSGTRKAGSMHPTGTDFVCKFSVYSGSPSPHHFVPGLVSIMMMFLYLKYVCMDIHLKVNNGWCNFPLVQFSKFSIGSVFLITSTYVQF